MSTWYTYVHTPIGELLLARNEQGITRIGFERGGHAEEPAAEWIRDDARFDDVRTQFGEYFGGTRRDFDLPLAPEGTAFQMNVWRRLRDIPYGETRSYGWLAEAIGNPAASRAVGAANGANPLPIVVPCHRVIGSNGSLTGFGGGIDVKRKLLELEQSQRPLLSTR